MISVQRRRSAVGAGIARSQKKVVKKAAPKPVEEPKQEEEGGLDDFLGMNDEPAPQPAATDDLDFLKDSAPTEKKTSDDPFDFLNF